MSRGAGRTERVPVRGRGRPFDADLGPDARGDTVAVYSRCRREPTFENSQYELPSYTTGRGCDVYRYSFRTRRESLLRSISRRDASETQPSISGQRVAFVRVYERRRGIAGAIPQVYIQHLRTRRRTSIAGGTLGRYRRIDGDIEGGPGPVGLELGPTILAFVWNSEPTSCESGADSFLGLFRSEVWVASLEGEQQLLEKACTGDEGRSFFSPAFDDGTLYYHRTRNQSDPATAEDVRRWNPASNQLETAQGPPGLIALAPLGATIFGSRYDPSNRRRSYAIEALGLSFGPVAR